jgi:hypothetical protein
MCVSIVQAAGGGKRSPPDLPANSVNAWDRDLRRSWKEEAAVCAKSGNKSLERSVTGILPVRSLPWLLPK